MPSGVYKRTIPVLNKGKKLSKEHIKKLSLAKIGKPSPRKGVKATPETIKKLRESHLGQKSYSKGLKFPERSGENHPRWIKDRSKLKKREQRNDSAYQYWRKQVLERAIINVK